MSNPRPNQDPLPTIDPAALAQVSGGGTATSSSTQSDQVLTALTGILDSIHSLASQNNRGGFNQQEMLMVMMIMQERHQQQAVAAPRPWPWSQEPVIRYY